MLHNAIKQWDLMLGVDLHPYPVPYFTFHIMIGTWVTAKYSPNFLTNNAMTMVKGTDIGPLIPHLGPIRPDLGLIILFSSSKSYFCSSRYITKNQEGNVAPVLGALYGIVNPNLNCGEPSPVPTGLVLTFTTHQLSMSDADRFAGGGAMLSDLLVQSLLSLGGNKVGQFITKQVRGMLIGYMMRRILDGKSVKGVKRISKIFEPVVKVSKFFSFGVSDTVDFCVGGPLGVDIGHWGISTPGGGAGDQSQEGFELGGRALADYIYNLSIDEYPINLP